MRGKSHIAHYHRYVLSGPGRCTNLPSGADFAELSLAYLVAFQHAVFDSISGCHGIQNTRNSNTPTVSPRTSAHAFYYRRPTLIDAASRLCEVRSQSDHCHSERSEESLISFGATRR